MRIPAWALCNFPAFTLSELLRVTAAVHGYLIYVMRTAVPVP